MQQQIQMQQQQLQHQQQQLVEQQQQNKMLALALQHQLALSTSALQPVKSTNNILRENIFTSQALSNSGPDSDTRAEREAPKRRGGRRGKAVRTTKGSLAGHTNVEPTESMVAAALPVLPRTMMTSAAHLQEFLHWVWIKISGSQDRYEVHILAFQDLSA
eukprot:symbB.v1.2.001783.t1/scaffold95.1/size600632/31